MGQRNAIIPGTDPEIEIYGELPPIAEKVEAEGIHAHDLREDREKFGDLANPLIDSMESRFNAPWWRFNSIACSVSDAIVRNRLIFHAGLPVVGISNLRWELTAAELAQRGELEIPQPEKSFPGRTGLLIGRSPFNYYHFINDILIFMEDLHAQVDALGLDRILINPCTAASDGFQRQLIEAIYPDLSDKVQFDNTVFHAERLTFVNVWPNYFQHANDGEAIKRCGPTGISRRAYRTSAAPFFDRAANALSAYALSGPEVLIISRKEAGRRQVLNEGALLDALSPYGAEAVAMENHTVAEQMALCAGAKVVIGPHGAGMANAGFCAPGTICIELTGRHYLQRGTDFASLAMIRGLEYQFAVADEEGDIVHMKGNHGNDIRLGQPVIDHIVLEVDRALGRARAVG